MFRGADGPQTECRPEPWLPWFSLSSASHRLCLTFHRPVADYLDETVVQGLKQIHQQVRVQCWSVPLSRSLSEPGHLIARALSTLLSPM